MKLIDPLAQSFFVKQKSGIYVTSIELYFGGKDDQLPVAVQLRPMELGSPSNKIFPFGEVILEPDDIEISNDSTVATKVVFESPVYLEGDRFHSVCLSSVSSEYTVWTAKLGEIDIRNITGPEKNQIVVTKQPLNGGLFKSQNATTWNEIPEEDLKFKLNRARFVDQGTFNLYNPDLNIGNAQIARLRNNPFDVDSRTLRLKTDQIVTDADLEFGNTIFQNNTNATGNYIGNKGTISTLTISNAGIGYTPSSGSNTFNGVSLVTLTGSGSGATANITVDNGSVSSVSIASTGSGYSIGDILTVDQIGSETSGRNLRLAVDALSGINELIIDDVQGEFEFSLVNNLGFINSSGITTELNGSGGNVLIPSDGISVVSDGLHFKVNHKNHAMYAEENVVEIEGALPDIKPTKLTSAYPKTATSTINIASSTNFTSFEGISVDATNLGYILIDEEIISYTGTTATTLTGITRGVDNTKVTSHSVNARVYKYEMNGVSLRRINRIHRLSDSDISNSIGLDYYHLKIDATENGLDRSTDVTYPKLYFKESKSVGGNATYASQNIQFDIITPQVGTLVLPRTSMSSSIRTISGRSVDGNEESFVDLGFQGVTLNESNYMTSPRLVCSKVNEQDKLVDNLPGGRSLTLALTMETSSDFISPAVDLDRIGVIYTSNRVNLAITDFVNDSRVSTLRDDPSAFVYATIPISLENAASSLNVLLAAHVNTYNDLRVLYGINNDPDDEMVYYPFPGYRNRLVSGEVTDLSESDGNPDVLTPKTTNLGFLSDEIEFIDYKFTVDNLPPFKYFSIKIVGSSTNQSYPPRLRDLRVIALA